MVGLEDGKDLFMGSPFDYQRAVLVAVPEDMPEPGRQGYATTVADAVEDIAAKLRDRVLVLFTSNSALESARRALSARLESAGIRLIAQGADGPPHRVMSELAREKEAVALGTSSLWEGVDLEGASIKASGDDPGCRSPYPPTRWSKRAPNCSRTDSVSTWCPRP